MAVLPIIILSSLKTLSVNSGCLIEVITDRKLALDSMTVFRIVISGCLIVN